MPDLNNLACTAADFGGLSAELLRLGKSVKFQAQGVSMYPLVRGGDTLLVLPVNPARLRVGDVVLCNVPSGNIVVHRVICRKSTPEGFRFLIQGDKSPRLDGWVAAANVQGKVVEIERGGKHLSLINLTARALGVLVALRLRGSYKSSRFQRIIGNYAKKLPVLKDYLS